MERDLEMINWKWYNLFEVLVESIDVVVRVYYVDYE